MDKKHNYKRDRAAWVTFTNGKKKQKLRSYIDFLSRSLCRMDGDGSGKNYKKFRDFLIEYYEEEGLLGIKLAYTIKSNELSDKK
jgi:hypothetical protein